jgi:hypothetical protein
MSKVKVAASIAAGNELAARIILADPVKYAGLPVMWARLWMSRYSRR